jgi:hypothetical protein
MVRKIMTLYKEWIDFVTFPKDADKVKSQEERLDTANAVYRTSEEFEQALIDGKGLVVTSDMVLFDDDKFEAMEISSGGGVFIWTKKRVWCLQHRGMSGIEKLNYFPRHPEFTDC